VADGDPWLDGVRARALALPEAAETVTWGLPTFRAGRRPFAVYLSADDDHGPAVVVRPDDDERAALEADDRFFVPAFFGAHGGLALDLAAAAVDWSEVAELLDASYRHVALQRMLRALDQRP